MKWYELLLLLLVVLMVLKNLLFKRKDNKLVNYFSIFSLLVMLVINIYCGIKITAFFILLSAIIYVLDCFRQLLHPEKLHFLNKKIPSIIVILLCGISFLMTCFLMPSFKAKPINGQYRIGQVSDLLTDKSRNDPYEETKQGRKINITIYYPSNNIKGYRKAAYLDGEAMAKSLGLPAFMGTYLKSVKSNSYINAPILKSKEKLPLVIFSHGLGAIPQAYKSIIEELASNGYIVVGVNHTDYSMFSVMDGTMIPFKANDVNQAMGTADKGNNEVIKEALGVWSADVQFVINEIKNRKINSEISDRIDWNNVAVMGHSFGGSTAAEVLYENNEIKAGIDLDGPIYGDALKGISQPFLFIISDREGINYDKIKKSGGDVNNVKAIMEHFFSSVTAFTEHSKGDIYKVTIKGSSHSSFADLLMYAPFKYFDQNKASINPEKALSITDKYVISFLNDKLKATGNQIDSIQPEEEVIVEYKE